MMSLLLTCLMAQPVDLHLTLALGDQAPLSWTWHGVSEGAMPTLLLDTPEGPLRVKVTLAEAGDQYRVETQLTHMTGRRFQREELLAQPTLQLPAGELAEFSIGAERLDAQGQWQPVNTLRMQVQVDPLAASATLPHQEVAE